MNLYKALITKENFTSFMEHYNSDRQAAKAFVDGAAPAFYGYGETCRKVRDNISKMFDLHFMGDESRSYTFSMENRDNAKLKVVVEYLAQSGEKWQVEAMQGQYLYLNFSGNHMVWDKNYCTLEKLPDYDSLTMAEARAMLSEDTPSFLPAEMGGISIQSVNNEKNKLKEKKKQVEQVAEDIRNAKTKELAKIEEQIQKLQDELYKKKQEMMEKIEEKISALNRELDHMNKQIYMMESEIYTIRSYSGETVELKKVRSGKKSPVDTPLVVNQKMMYLDEDLARIVSIYKDEIACQFNLFSEALAGSDEVFESFCPQDRCLTFFRLSKSASYNYMDSNSKMYVTEELIHGKKIGFVLRDLECAYIGWMDESWRKDEKGKPVAVTFKENLIYKPKQTDIHEVFESDMGICSDDQNSMLSRVFALSVVQGILDNKNLLEFPKKVNITKPSQYIIYNFASGWITDDRFGDFATLVDNLNKRTKVKDTILICYNKNCGLQGKGEADRTHDCYVKEGLNKVNLIESDDYGRCTIYVSAKKEYSQKGATANVLCHPREYINITYMNSIWLKYYVQTKKLGAYVEDYAKMIKHFKRAIEVIMKRESEEIAMIEKYYPDAGKIHEWQILLSHWKLNNSIRFINDFQAKRIAMYLKAGKYFENENLFKNEEYYSEDITAGGKYSRTSFSWTFPHLSVKSGFGTDSDYGKQSFYVSGYDDSTYWRKEDIEERDKKNELLLLEELPKLETLVPDRLKKDEEKLSLVNQYVKHFMDSHNVKVKDLGDDFACNGLTFDKKNNEIGYMNVHSCKKEASDARKVFLQSSVGEYPKYILKSKCWKVAYYDYIHNQYGKVLYKVKMILHKRFMNDTILNNTYH